MSLADSSSADRHRPSGTRRGLHWRVPGLRVRGIHLRVRACARQYLIHCGELLTAGAQQQQRPAAGNLAADRGPVVPTGLVAHDAEIRKRHRERRSPCRAANPGQRAADQPLVSHRRVLLLLPRPLDKCRSLGCIRRVKAREATACGLALTRRIGPGQSSAEGTPSTLAAASTTITSWPVAADSD